MNLIYKFLNNRIAVTSTFLAITVLILYMTLMPSNRIGSFAIYEYDKLGHFMVFFVWSLSFGLLINSFKKSYVNLYLVFFTGSLFGICIELLQGWMEHGRTPDYADAIADILGCLAAVVVLKVMKPYLQKNTVQKNHTGSS